MKTIKVKKSGPHVEDYFLPQYATPNSAGVDLRSTNPVRIMPGEVVAVPTGLMLEIPEGYEGQVRPRSGLAIKSKITVANAPGTVDSDFRGEVKVLLTNFGTEPFTINVGDRIAQLVISKYECCNFCWWDEDLTDTERGTGGFGSTGVS
jgi:dUTP pyrophosphatase